MLKNNLECKIKQPYKVFFTTPKDIKQSAKLARFKKRRKRYFQNSLEIPDV